MFGFFGTKPLDTKALVASYLNIRYPISFTEISYIGINNFYCSLSIHSLQVFMHWKCGGLNGNSSCLTPIGASQDSLDGPGVNLCVFQNIYEFKVSLGLGPAPLCLFIINLFFHFPFFFTETLFISYATVIIGFLYFRFKILPL